MKKSIPLLFSLALVVLAFSSCRREPDTLTYSSRPSAFLNAFYDRHKPRTESFTFQAAAGHTYTTQKGTVVVVPPNAFVDQSGQPYNHVVTVSITDLYKKSEMLFADMHTVTTGGMLLESAGEFNIKAVNSIQVPLELAPGAFIRIEQPLQPQQQIEPGMMAFIAEEDSAGGNGWALADTTSAAPLVSAQANYIFTLYSFSTPLGEGTWCNSDQPAFGSMPTTTLTLHGTDDHTEFATDVFLIFSGTNSMIHVYADYAATGSIFPYNYAPQGQSCTLVAIGAKDDQLYASFVPVTIGTQPTNVNFTLAPISENDFVTQLDALN
ncbi:MAG: hypothetical protein MUC87_01820 [Bacteroidia bacterium]|jgi:hypothetical protein|nr:hypothetical protein [Bacteroidia bacterium]